MFGLHLHLQVGTGCGADGDTQLEAGGCLQPKVRVAAEYISTGQPPGLVPDSILESSEPTEQRRKQASQRSTPICAKAPV